MHRAWRDKKRVKFEAERGILLDAIFDLLEGKE